MHEVQRPFLKGKTMGMVMTPHCDVFDTVVPEENMFRVIVERLEDDGKVVWTEYISEKKLLGTVALRRLNRKIVQGLHPPKACPPLDGGHLFKALADKDTSES